MVEREGTIILKFGGSCLTRKNSFETLNEEGLCSAVKCVALARRDYQRVVVVHGAGSFGHFQVRKTLAALCLSACSK